ncbi:MAG: succinate--CoA ligase subunit alpha [Dethiobacter sp.]|nr:MAG: succinate--CoA ligase subunit alpha [Dethiobacter sp.]
MAIFIDENTRVMVQGITGNQGTFHTKQMLAYGTNIVAGVSPGKGGRMVEKIPVYDTVESAFLEHKPDAAILFVPAPFARDGVLETLSAGIKVIVVVTEGIPVHDAMDMIAMARLSGAIVVGPNTFGVISSGKCKLGIMPHQYYVQGPVGVVARSGTLSYEIVANLKEAGYGTSTAVGLGGDRVVGLSFTDVIRELEADSETELIVMVGEIGGTAEEEAAHYIKNNVKKPVIAYLAGKSAPPGKRMGHAGAIIERGQGTFQAKVQALESAGVRVAELPFEVSYLAKEFLD